MAGEPEAVFEVNAYSEPVILRILGRACFSNCTVVKDFFRTLFDQGKRRFIVDFQHCASMDSTFLGILAGAGLQLMRADPPGVMVLSRLGPRNLELVRNLGLHRILLVDDEAVGRREKEAMTPLVGPAEPQSEIEAARTVLEAHEDLVEIDESNRNRFQDVIAFLRNQVDED